MSTINSLLLYNNDIDPYSFRNSNISFTFYSKYSKVPYSGARWAGLKIDRMTGKTLSAELLHISIEENFVHTLHRTTWSK